MDGPLLRDTLSGQTEDSWWIRMGTDGHTGRSLPCVVPFVVVTRVRLSAGDLNIEQGHRCFVFQHFVLPL